jgi:hypothetical protein
MQLHDFELLNVLKCWFNSCFIYILELGIFGKVDRMATWNMQLGALWSLNSNIVKVSHSHNFFQMTDGQKTDGG